MLPPFVQGVGELPSIPKRVTLSRQCHISCHECRSEREVDGVCRELIWSTDPGFVHF